MTETTATESGAAPAPGSSGSRPGTAGTAKSESASLQDYLQTADPTAPPAQDTGAAAAATLATPATTAQAPTAGAGRQAPGTAPATPAETPPQPNGGIDADSEDDEDDGPPPLAPHGGGGGDGGTAAQGGDLGSDDDDDDDDDDGPPPLAPHGGGEGEAGAGAPDTPDQPAAEGTGSSDDYSDYTDDDDDDDDDDDGPPPLVHRASVEDGASLPGDGAEGYDDDDDGAFASAGEDGEDDYYSDDDSDEFDEPPALVHRASLAEGEGDDESVELTATAVELAMPVRGVAAAVIAHVASTDAWYKGEPGCITLTGFLDVMTAPTLGLCYAAPELELLRTVINQVIESDEGWLHRSGDGTGTADDGDFLLDLYVLAPTLAEVTRDIYSTLEPSPKHWVLLDYGSGHGRFWLQKQTGECTLRAADVPEELRRALRDPGNSACFLDDAGRDAEAAAAEAEVASLEAEVAKEREAAEARRAKYDAADARCAAVRVKVAAMKAANARKVAAKEETRSELAELNKVLRKKLDMVNTNPELQEVRMKELEGTMAELLDIQKARTVLAADKAAVTAELQGKYDEVGQAMVKIDEQTTEVEEITINQQHDLLMEHNELRDAVLLDATRQNQREVNTDIEAKIAPIQAEVDMLDESLNKIKLEIRDLCKKNYTIKKDIEGRTQVLHERRREEEVALDVSESGDMMTDYLDTKDEIIKVDARIILASAALARAADELEGCVKEDEGRTDAFNRFAVLSNKMTRAEMLEEKVVNGLMFPPISPQRRSLSADSIDGRAKSPNYSDHPRRSPGDRGDLGGLGGHVHPSTTRMADAEARLLAEHPFDDDYGRNVGGAGNVSPLERRNAPTNRSTVPSSRYAHIMDRNNKVLEPVAATDTDLESDLEQGGRESFVDKAVKQGLWSEWFKR